MINIFVFNIPIKEVFYSRRINRLTLNNKHEIYRILKKEKDAVFLLKSFDTKVLFSNCIGIDEYSDGSVYANFDVILTHKEQITKYLRLIKIKKCLEIL